jgi:hypothetical protein
VAPMSSLCQRRSLANSVTKRSHYEASPLKKRHSFAKQHLKVTIENRALCLNLAY